MLVRKKSKELEDTRGLSMVEALFSHILVVKSLLSILSRSVFPSQILLGYSCEALADSLSLRPHVI